MTTSSFIDVTVQDKVMTIRMNRPEKKNAINREMYDAMRTALLDADERNDVNIILFAGLEESFTVGNDLADFNDRSVDEISPGGQFLLVLNKVKKPIIAAVNGLAVGIGTTLLFHCDLAYASDTARFRMPFVNLGICPEAGSTLLLPRISGHLKASELFMFGDFFNSEEALQANIINHICSSNTLEEYATTKAQDLASKPLNALMETKRLMKSAYVSETEGRIHEELKIFGQLLQSEESKNARRNALKK